MHISRKPGEQIEVDWAGDPAAIIDPDTNEIIPIFIFAGVLTYGQYSYVEACENFYEKVKMLLSTDEAARLSAIRFNEISEILISYRNENLRRKYHPSSYLQLLLFYIHKFGYSRTKRILLEYDKRQENNYIFNEM